MQEYNSYGTLFVTEYDNGSALLSGAANPYQNGLNLGGYYDDIYFTAAKLYYYTVDQMLNGYAGSIVLLVVTGLVTVISAVFVVVRLYIRKIILKNFFVDDWFVSIALIFGIASGASYIAYGTASALSNSWPHNHRPFAMLSVEGSKYLAKLGVIILRGERLFYIFVNGQALFARLAIFMTFHRLAISQKVRNVRLLIRITAVIMVLGSFAITWLQVNPCFPAQSLFYPMSEEMDGKCLIFHVWPDGQSGVYWNYYFLLASAIFNAVMDLFAFALPFIVFRLPYICKSRRRELYLLFGFGFFVFIISVVRGIQSYLLTKQTVGLNLATQRQQVFAIGEANAVMVGACFPVLVKPVRERIRRWKAARATTVHATQTAQPGDDTSNVDAAQVSEQKLNRFFRFAEAKRSREQ